MKHLGLFEGIGGFSLAARWAGWKTIAWCEINPFCQKVLKHHFPNATGHSDIKQTDFSIYRGKVDVLTGGFPCQDASIAKQFGEGQLGLSGERTGLLFEMCRAIREIRPKFIVAENVANILRTNGGADFSTILTELSGMGYNAEWRVCRASEVGAPHHRARMYLVAYPDNIRLSKGQTLFSHVHETSQPVSWFAHGTSVQTFRGGAWGGEPPVLCVDDGVPDRAFGLTDSQSRKQRIMGYGNAIAPQLGLQIFKAINEYNTIHKVSYKG